jgi:hypothetical protein
MDWESVLYRESGISEEEAELGYLVPVPALRAKLEDALPTLLLSVAPGPGEEAGSYYVAVGYQMLASMLMAQGCAISCGMRQAIADGVVSCPEYQLGCKLLSNSGGNTITEEAYLAAGLLDVGFGTQGQRIGRLTGRVNAINRLYSALQNYDIKGGVPYAYLDRGLFEVR